MKQLPGKLYRKPQLLVRLSPAEAAHKKLKIIRHRIENIRNHPIKAPLKIFLRRAAALLPIKIPDGFRLDLNVAVRQERYLSVGAWAPYEGARANIIEGIPLL